MSRSRRGKKAGEDAERLLQEAFGVSEDQLLKDFILAQTEVKDSDIPPGSEDGFERLMAKLEAARKVKKNHPARTLSNCTKKLANHAG